MKTLHNNAYNLRASRRRWRGWAGAAPSLFILAVLVIYPLLTLIAQIFLPHLFDVKVSFAPSLTPMVQALGDKLNLESLLNSFIIGIAASIFATILGTLTAFGAVRTSKRFRVVIDVLVWIIFFAPSYVIAQGWMIFMQDGGVAAQLFGLHNGWSAWFFTKAGLVAAMGLRYFPFVHLAMVPAITNLGNQFERAAQSLGSTKFRTFWRITLPLLTPGLLAGASIAFAEGFGDFGFAAAITPETHIPLLAYQIYAALNQAPVDYATAAVLSLLLLLVMGGTIWLQMWWLRKGSYTTVSSSSDLHVKNYAGRRGIRWQSVIALVIVALAFVAPVGSTVMASLWKTFSGGINLSNWTLAAYSHALHMGGDGLSSLLRSLGYSTVAGLVTMFLALYVAYQMQRQKSAAMSLVNAITMATIAVPGVVLAAGFIFAWNARWLEPLHLVLYGTTICLGMAYVAGSLPYAIRLDMGAVTQLSPNLMTAARALGAAPRTVMWRIVLPLIGSTAVSTFFMTLTGTMFELPASSLLYPAGQPPFPVEIASKFNAFEWAQGSALTVIGMVLVLGLYLIGRYLVERLSRTKSGSMSEMTVENFSVPATSLVSESGTWPTGTSGE